MSKFVSYADLPPILAVEPPIQQDFACWRKRWKKIKTKQVLDFWVRFYALKFGQSVSEAELSAWGQLLRLIKFAFSIKALTALRSIYAEERDCLMTYAVI